jgi:transcriptional regulator with XRE-family HTH domain
MRKTWSEIKNETMRPERQLRVHELALQDVADLELRELREVLQFTQSDLAKKLKSSQVAVSRMESRRNVLVETLDEYIEGLGGKLEIRAVFPKRTVRLTNFLRKKITGADIRRTAKIKTAARPRTKRATRRRKTMHA